MDYESLVKELGGFGQYQILQFVLLCFIYMIPGMQNFSSIFTTLAPQVVCLKPVNASFVCTEKQDGIRGNESGLNSSSACHSWKFDQRLIQTSIVSEYTLLCSSAYLTSLSTTIYMAGFLVGSSIFGTFSDRFGRLRILLISGLQILIFGIATPFSPKIEIYMVGRFIVGMGVSGVLSITLTFSLENVSVANRSFIGMLLNFGWSTGILFLCLFAYFIRDYKYLEIIIALPAVLTAFTFFFLQKSPKWLITRGDVSSAQDSCRAIAKFNNVEMNSLKITNNLKVENDAQSVGSTETTRENLLHMLKYSGLRLMCIKIWFQFIVVTLVYYGVSLGVGDLAGNLYLNTAIGAFLEFPSYLAASFLIKRFGRISLLIICYFAAGLACLTVSFLQARKGLDMVIVISSMVGRIFISIAFVAHLLYSAEVSPTCVRNTFVGIVSAWARVGGMLAPQIMLFEYIWKPIPYMIYGVLSFLSAVICFTLPETNNRKSPNTLDEGEEFIQKKKKPENSAGCDTGEEINSDEKVSLKPIVENVDSTAANLEA